MTRIHWLAVLGALAACGDGTARYCVQPHFSNAPTGAAAVVNLTLTKPGDPSPMTSTFQNRVPNAVTDEVCATKLDDGIEPGWTATAWVETLPTDGGLGSCEVAPFTCAPQPGEPSATQTVSLDPSKPVAIEFTLK